MAVYANRWNSSRFPCRVLRVSKVTNSTLFKVSQESLRYVGVALLFAACGALSARMFLQPSDFPPMQSRMQLVFPLPFALLCSLLFMRTWRLVFIIPSMFVAWLAVTATAISTWASMGGFAHPVLPGCAGGLVGGLAITASAGISQSRLLSLPHLAAGCVIGGIAAAPLGFWLDLVEQSSLGVMLSFGVWQAAMGTYLYAACANAKKK